MTNWFAFKRLGGQRGIRLSWRDSYPCLEDWTAPAGATSGHYFYQDLWAAKKVYDSGVTHHVDVGSRLDGFVAHLIPFCQVTYVDIREVQSGLENLVYVRGSLLDLPFERGSVSSLSCLHVLEHVGLGRYGDPIEPDGHRKAAHELGRVLAPGGRLLIGVPVGVERVCFNAHRVLDPSSVLEMFVDLTLAEFSLIDDEALTIIQDAPIEEARRCKYGCGLFEFTKK